MTISLAFLAPDLVKAAIDGRLPHGMGVARLCDLPALAPDAWTGRAVTFQSNRASELQWPQTGARATLAA
jgi:hypothetical protein